MLDTLIPLLFVFLLVLLIAAFGISFISDVVINIKWFLHFKNKKGKWVIKNLNGKGFVIEIDTNGYASGNLTDAAVFRNQHEAVKAIEKCIFKNNFLILQV